MWTVDRPGSALFRVSRPMADSRMGLHCTAPLNLKAGRADSHVRFERPKMGWQPPQQDQ